jgi:nicotinate phosphoribosyltransferase
MTFEDEKSAFEAYGAAFPFDSVFLADTFDTLEGVKNAIEIAKKLRAKGSELLGIRLDSGDLAYLSIEARKLLDAAGFPKVTIVASNDLDEYLISSLKQQGAKIDTWGVGTKLVTAFDQPALGGVYKLGALKDDNGNWQYKLKLSEQLVKVSTPGIQQVRRFKKAGKLLADMIYNEAEKLPETLTITDPLDSTKQKTISSEINGEDLLVPVFRKGELVYELPSLPEIQARTLEQVNSLDPTIRRFLNPHTYPVGLESSLYQLKTDLIRKLRQKK